jgi:hypothetical protein
MLQEKYYIIIKKKLPAHLSPFFDYDGEDYKAKNYGNYKEETVQNKVTK